MPTLPLEPRPESRERARFAAEITDFSLGIFSDIYSGFGTSAPPSAITRNGAATIDSTFRCCADPASGALVPLPRGKDGFSATLIAGNANNTPNTYYPTNFVADYCLDIVAMAALQYNGAADDVVVMMFGAHINPAGTGSTFYPYVITKAIAHTAAAGRDIGFSKGSTAVSGITIPSGSAVMIRRITNGVDPVSATVTDFFATVAHSAANVTGAWATGNLSATEQSWTDYDSWASGPAYEDGFASWFYPNVKDTQSHAKLGLTNGAGFITTAHQGRLVMAGFLLNQMDNIIDHVVEYIDYTDVYDLDDAGGEFFVPADPPSSYCTLGSMSADELLLVKGSGGAILIRGDLNGDFQLVRLPFVESTGGIFTKGTVSPIGFVYLTRRGVYVWSGGDTSQLLSPQLDGFFWSISEIASVYVGNRGTPAYIYPFLAVPNSFVYDIRTQAWWRLEDVSTVTPFSGYAASAQVPRLYAAKFKKTASDNVVYRFFDFEDLAYTYSWQSQPLLESDEYRLQIEEVELIAQPHTDSSSSTVVITLSAFNEDGTTVTPVSTTFTLNASNKRPQRLRKRLSISGVNVQVKIVADGNSHPAPKVYGPLRLIGQQIARSPYAS